MNSSSSLASIVTTPRIQLAATGFCALIIIGLFTNVVFRILPSIGIIGVTVTALVNLVVNRRVEQRLAWAAYLPLVVVFFLHVAGGVHNTAGDAIEYWRDVVLQSPFLLLPVAFWLLPYWQAKHLHFLWQLFFALICLAALGSTINYLLHAEEINAAYLRSQVMPTEPDHIRFSLMIALATTYGIALLSYNDARGKIGKWRHWVLGGVIFLALYLHMLAVRSGLVTFYSVAGMTILWLIVKKARYRLGTLFTAGLLLLPVVSYVLFPTFRNKFQNTQEDISRVEETSSANNYSLTGRVYSYKVAMMLVEENPFFGVGNARMAQEIAEKYEDAFPRIEEDAYIKPHNQFLYCLVAFGCVGLLLFTAAFYYPFVWAWSQHAPLLYAQYLILTLSFLVEYTLEAQIGLTYSLLFLLLPLAGLVSRKANKWHMAC